MLTTDTDRAVSVIISADCSHRAYAGAWWPTFDVADTDAGAVAVARRSLAAELARCGLSVDAEVVRIDHEDDRVSVTLRWSAESEKRAA